MRLQNRRRVGVVFWVVGAAAAVGWANLRPPVQASFVGYGHAEVMRIQAAENARIGSVEAELHQPIAAGEVAVRLDATLLEKQREVLAAELLALAMPGADVEEQVDAARDEAKRIRKRAELATIEARLQRLRGLIEEGAASASEATGLEAKRRELLVQLGREDGEPLAPESSTWNVVVAAKRIEELDVRIAALDLRSTLTGEVMAVHRRAGEVVRRGDPVLEIRESATDELMAWLPAGVSVSAGEDVRVHRGDGSQLTASVVSVGAGPTLKPAKARLDPTREEFGVAVLLRLEEGATVGPDEPVRLQPLRTGAL